MRALTSQQQQELQQFETQMGRFAGSHKARCWTESDEGRITVEHRNAWKQQTRLVLQLPGSGVRGWVLTVETLTPWDEIEVGLFQPDDLPDRFQEALEQAWTWAQDHIDANWQAPQRDVDELLTIVEAAGDAADPFRSWRRRQAMLALAGLGDERAIGPLIAALEDEDQMVVEAAAQALGDVGDETALAPLQMLAAPGTTAGI